MRLLATVGVLVFTLSGQLAYAHGAENSAGMTSSGGMMKMMEMMHGNIDKNQSFDCNGASDMETMEKGEEMMEEMMGHDDHEKMEESLNEEDHDSMHTMMGMWASGCVGDEIVNTLMERHGVSDRFDDNGFGGQADWQNITLGIIIGLIGGWAGGQFLKKKTITG